MTALAAVYWVTQVWNYTPIERMPNSDSVAFAARALPPLLAWWIGARIMRGEKASWLLAFGLVVAMAVYGIAFAMLLAAADTESMAPILLLAASLWIAAGLFGLIIGVWVLGRRNRDRASP